MEMFDIAILSIIGFSAVFGLYKGIIRIVIGFIALISSVYLAYHLIPFVAPFVQEKISSNVISTVVTYMASYVIMAIMCGLAARFVIKIIGPISGGIIDRSLGLVFGAVRGLFFTLIAFTIIVVVSSGSYSKASSPSDLFANLKQENYPQWLKNSTLFEKLNSLFNGLLQSMPKNVMMVEFPGIPQLPKNTITFDEEISNLAKDQIPKVIETLNNERLKSEDKQNQ